MSSPWDRQEYDSDAAWAAFLDYKDMGLPRSLNVLLQQYLRQDATTVTQARKVPTKSIDTLKRWSTSNNWQERAKAWDVEQDRIRAEVEREQAKKHYEKRLEQYRRRNEELGNSLMETASVALELIQRQLEMYQGQDEVPIALLTALLRQSASNAEAGSKLSAQALGVEKLMEQLGQDGEAS